jgi:branched-chain amino acid transport system ATP-binding protein
MLLVEDLCVQYGRIRAVDGISISVEEGATVGLIGPNGAGKSSTLAAIVGLIRPTGGSVRFKGEELIGKRSESIARRGIALVPERRHIFATLTVAENLHLGMTARRDRANVRADLERELERFPVLKRTYSTHAGRLSGGEQQQLAIARALLARPELLILDEPSLGLAPLIVDALFDVLEGLRSQRITILLVEQNAMRTVEFADYCYVMRSGRVALTGTRAELEQAQAMSAAYLGA